MHKIYEVGQKNKTTPYEGHICKTIFMGDKISTPSYFRASSNMSLNWVGLDILSSIKNSYENGQSGGIDILAS